MPCVPDRATAAAPPPSRGLAAVWSYCVLLRLIASGLAASYCVWFGRGGLGGAAPRFGAPWLGGSHFILRLIASYCVLLRMVRRLAQSFQPLHIAPYCALLRLIASYCAWLRMVRRLVQSFHHSRRTMAGWQPLHIAPYCILHLIAYCALLRIAPFCLLSLFVAYGQGAPWLGGSHCILRLIAYCALLHIAPYCILRLIAYCALLHIAPYCILCLIESYRRCSRRMGPSHARCTGVWRPLPKPRQTIHGLPWQTIHGAPPNHTWFREKNHTRFGKPYCFGKPYMVWRGFKNNNIIIIIIIIIRRRASPRGLASCDMGRVVYYYYQYYQYYQYYYYHYYYYYYCLFLGVFGAEEGMKESCDKA